MTERKDAKLLRDRETRLLDYIQKGYSAPEIGRREGIQADYALKLRNAVARKHGLIVKGPKSKTMPYGLDDESRIFRIRLGNKLYYLLDKLKIPQLEVARRVGVPRKLQKKAMEKPFAYDWKLSEIQQLAKELGVPFKDFVTEMLEENSDATV